LPPPAVARSWLGIVAVAVAGMLCPSLAQAEFVSGNDLFTACSDVTSSFERGNCLGYISAVADTMALGAMPMTGWNACIPAEATRGQVRDVAVQYLQTHPALRHTGAESLVGAALTEAFPCR
jgi:hypothetical protein